MQSKFPTGQALEDSIRASNITLEATWLRNEQQILYETAVQQCVRDNHVKTLFSSTMAEASTRGFN